jgi:hypothetical protein
MTRKPNGVFCGIDGTDGKDGKDGTSVTTTQEFQVVPFNHQKW